MEIVLDIKKKYLYIFGVILLLLFSGYVIAVDNPNVFHDVLYTDHIKPHYLLTRMEVNAASGTSNPFFFLVNYNGDEVAAVTMGFDGNRNVIVKHNLAVEGELCDNRDGDNCVEVADLIDLVNGGGTEQVTLTVIKSGSGSVTSTSNPSQINQINCLSTQTTCTPVNYNSGTSVTLVASDSSASWMNCNSVSLAGCTVDMQSDNEITVFFD